MQELEATVAQVKSAEAQHEDLRVTIAQQQKEIQALTEQITKVSDRLEVSKPGARVAGNVSGRPYLVSRKPCVLPEPSV